MRTLLPILPPPLAPQAVPLIMKVLSKSMDSSLTTDKVELATVTRDEATGQVCTPANYLVPSRHYFPCIPTKQCAPP